MKTNKPVITTKNNELYDSLIAVLKRYFDCNIVNQLMLEIDGLAEVYNESKNQGVSALVYTLLQENEKDQISSGIINRWKLSSIQTYVRNEKIISIQGRIVRRFTADNISYVIAKGVSASYYYKQYNRMYRYQGDIDIIINIDSFSKVRSVMESMNAKTTYRDELRMKFSVDAICIEIETNRFGISFDSISDYGEIATVNFDGCEGFPAMPIELQMIFAIRHMRNHILESSIGLRHFMDFAVVYSAAKEQGNLDTLIRKMNNSDRKLFIALSQIADSNFLDSDGTTDGHFQDLFYDTLDGGEFGRKSKYRTIANSFVRKYRFPSCFVKLFAAMTLYVGGKYVLSNNKTKRSAELVYYSFLTYAKSSRAEKNELLTELRRVRYRRKLYKEYGLV